MPTAPKNTDKPCTRLAVRTELANTQNTPGLTKDVKKKPQKNKIDVNKKEDVSHQDKSAAKSGYVCSVCQNVDSIRYSRLKLETDLLGDASGKISELKLSLDNNLSTIESFDLHVKHLLLNPNVFENYQSSVTKIENMCSVIQNDIHTLNNNSSVNVDVTDYNNLDTINQNISKTDNRIREIDTTLELINKNIECMQTSLGDITNSGNSNLQAQSSALYNVHRDSDSTTPTTAPESFISDYRENFISNDEALNFLRFYQIKIIDVKMVTL